ncbi:phosphoinositide phosphatase sac9-related [Anaeramoeba flamelloides]|uniref:Phosphoinositide phosphatase sac9-related n=1 Tax=Anaeramoeba flamelloides TaxID=1746091 RepID=A0AAV8AD07_9EUKA|nr:phosphoinositide phosphatase sac9-related [Anaeramoeba flamelloides]
MVLFCSVENKIINIWKANEKLNNIPIINNFNNNFIGNSIKKKKSVRVNGDKNDGGGGGGDDDDDIQGGFNQDKKQKKIIHLNNLLNSEIIHHENRDNIKKIIVSNILKTPKRKKKKKSKNKKIKKRSLTRQYSKDNLIYSPKISKNKSYSHHEMQEFRSLSLTFEGFVKDEQSHSIDSLNFETENEESSQRSEFDNNEQLNSQTKKLNENNNGCSYHLNLLELENNKKEINLNYDYNLISLPILIIDHYLEGFIEKKINNQKEEEGDKNILKDILKNANNDNNKCSNPNCKKIINDDIFFNKGLINDGGSSGGGDDDDDKKKKKKKKRYKCLYCLKWYCFNYMYPKPCKLNQQINLKFYQKKSILKPERLNNLVFACFSLKEIIFSPKHSQLTSNQKKSQPKQYLRNILKFPYSCILSQVPTDHKSAPIESLMYPNFLTYKNFWFAPENCTKIEILIALGFESEIHEIQLIVDSLGYNQYNVPLIQIFGGNTWKDVEFIGNWDLKNHLNKKKIKIKPGSILTYSLPEKNNCKILKLLSILQQKENENFIDDDDDLKMGMYDKVFVKKQ